MKMRMLFVCDITIALFSLSDIKPFNTFYCFKQKGIYCDGIDYKETTDEEILQLNMNTVKVMNKSADKFW